MNNEDTWNEKGFVSVISKMCGRIYQNILGT